MTGREGKNEAMLAVHESSIGRTAYFNGQSKLCNLAFPVLWKVAVCGNFKAARVDWKDILLTYKVLCKYKE